MKAARARPTATPAAAASAPARRDLALALLCALAGLVLALLLVREHANAHAGLTSFCAIGDLVNCDRVATSRWSVELGLPVAVWGVFGYALAAGLAAWGLRRGRRPHPSWPAGLLVVVAALAVAASVTLAVVSEALVGAWCLLCMGSWVAALLLLVFAWRTARPAGLRAAVRADAAALRAHPRLSLAALLGAAALVGAVELAYPHYWERPARSAAVAAPSAAGARPAPPAAQKQPAEGPAGVRGEGVPQVTAVVEFSDYECPFCARAHAENRLFFAGRPDLQLLRKQFPLDPTCNPAVKRAVHLTACELARAAICARAQGKFDAMDDALFANQRAHRPVAEIARSVGLDLDRFGVCLDAPETTRRLQAEIEEGIRAEVNATPTYVVDGHSYAGEIPPGVLPPRPGGG